MASMKRLGVLAIPLLILLAGAVPAFAQGGQGNGTLVGTVVDNVGVIPGATVTATHVATNTNRTGTTNEQGEFRLVSLVPGRYVVKVEMDGFRPVTIAEFSLLGGEIRPLGRITMSPGGVAGAGIGRGMPFCAESILLPVCNLQRPPGTNPAFAGSNYWRVWI